LNTSWLTQLGVTAIITKLLKSHGTPNSNVTRISKRKYEEKSQSISEVLVVWIKQTRPINTPISFSIVLQNPIDFGKKLKEFEATCI
jgi:hypothetical protein